MPTPKKGARLGGSPAHQRLIVANLATALFEHGRITTTEAKARVLRPVAEKLITKAKKGDLHNRRQVLATIRDKGVVHTLFEDIAPRFAERPGGYTRITKIGPRKGDNAPMAVIELVTEEYTAKSGSQPATKATATPAPAAAEPTETAPADEVESEETVEHAPAEETDTTAPDTEAGSDTEATDEAGETQVVETEAADVDTAEAQSQAEPVTQDATAVEPSHRAEAPAEPDADSNADAKDDDQA